MLSLPLPLPLPLLSVDYLLAYASPDSLTASHMDESAVYSLDSSDSLGPEDDLVNHSEGGCCRDGNFAAEVEQLLVSVAVGDEVVMIVVVLGGRDGEVEWRKLGLMVPHGCGAFEGDWVG